MRAGRRHREPDAIGRRAQLRPDLQHLVLQLGTSSQMVVPTSTIDWCISRFIWSPSDRLPAASSSETCERSSQVLRIDDLELLLDADREPVRHG